MAYRIEFRQRAIEDLDTVPAFYARQLIDVIDRSLSDQPTVTARNRKPLEDLAPSWWDESLPIWQLRVGDFRVLYAVDDSAGLVTVVRVFEKGRKTTTEGLEGDQ